MQDSQTLDRVNEDLAHAGEGDLLDMLLRHAGATPRSWVRWTIGRQVWFLRVSLDLTQTELARRAGVVQSHVAKVEQGRDVRLSTLRKLYGAMGFELLIMPHPRGDVFADQPRPRRHHIAE